MQRGTVIDVVGFDQGPVAISADSREYYRDGRVNEVCKIAALGNKLIVGVTGYAGNGNDFSVFESAREVFNSIPEKQREVKELATYFVGLWKDSLLEHVNRELDAGRITAVGNTRITNAITIGLNDKGVISEWVIPIYIEQSTVRRIAYSPPLEPRDRWPMIGAFGEEKISVEARDATTDRGIQWNRQLSNDANRLPITERSTYNSP